MKYLIDTNIYMQRCLTNDINGKKYQFVIGNNNVNKQVAMVWRSVKELTAFAYDLLYINGQDQIEGYQPIEKVFKN